MFSLAAAPNGDVWVGTPDGLNRLHGNKVDAFTSADGLPDDFIRSLLVDRDKSLWIGTRRGLSLTVVFYSVVSVLTSLARGFYSFAAFRFLLGAGESANWPAATKAVSEWFPSRERGLATALFDSGSSVGGAIASWLILSIYFRWGWRPAFAIPGMLGFIWVLVWRWLYHPPESHPRISEAERQMILADKQESRSPNSCG